MFVLQFFTEPRYWSNSVKNLTWLRNHIVVRL